MTLTYVFHSCFVLETDKSILIFDYWLDLNSVVPPFLKKDKPVYVFSSHFHEDHLNSVIFEWRTERAVRAERSGKAERDEDIDPIAHEKQYLGELKDIRKITDSFDVVMFPIDGRIGNGYTLGGRQFIERFKVGLFVPMHFVASGFESSWRMKEFTDEKDIPFWEISREGETIEI